MAYKHGRASNKPGWTCITLLLIGVSASAAAQAQADADDGAADDAELLDEIVVKAFRQTLRQSLAVKRSNTVISDALIGAEIGDLPDLSIAESLERIPGVTSDRFKGGASELSIRGLGAFLGSSILNGREITSGSDGRDVNFGQFPSELIGGTVVYKSQQASFIEGGVSGIIELQTLRPLDYGKRRLQVEALAGYSDYENRVADGEPVSGRYTLSYTDLFDTGVGEFGLAIGGQIRRDTAPEDIYTSSSTYRPCNTIEGVDNSNNCSYSVDGNGVPDGASDTYFVSNQYIYRAMQTQADRDSVMGNFQWRPNDRWDINIDAQYAERDDIERRHNLVVADGRRDIAPLAISPSGALEAWTGETRLENQSVWRRRAETYEAWGLNVAWSGERLTLTGDVGFSSTERRQDEKDMRIRTNSRALFTLDTRGVDVPDLTLDDVSAIEANTGLVFDLNNHDLYTNGARARRRLENVDDEIISVRFDGSYAFEGGSITSLDFGLRGAERDRVGDDGIDTTVSLVDDNYLNPESIAARRTSFPVEDLFEGANTAMDGITWATWNPQALWLGLTGDADAGLPVGSTLSPDDADVNEETLALYLQANFERELFGLPASGNFGVRAVRTEITSVGISTPLQTTPNPDGSITVTPTGELTTNVETNDFWNVLPSANLSLELREDMLLRFALYSAIARPDPGAMSAALDFDDEADLADIAGIVSAAGNAALEPLESNNFDISWEWYLSEDTAFSSSFYYKDLQTGFETQISELTVVVDGVATPVLIGRTANSNDSSTLWGVEVTAQHVFTNLPKPFDGLGIRAAYNYADSDFEFPDPTVPDGVNALADFTTPANIPGYSRNTGNVTLFWENDFASLRLAYKARSSYFKPFRANANRFTDSQDFLDFSASFDLTDILELRFQALNLLDEPNVFFRPTGDSLAQADYSGRRIFLGLRARF
ncbi:MAG: TonB-dependent receptor [Pseudomonadota bacterium]